MRKAVLTMAMLLWIGSASIPGFAQENEHHLAKAGLWEVTSTMSWQKTPGPVGNGPGAPPSGGSHTSTVCLTQAMVDAGALLPQSRGQCRIENKVIKPGSITADYVCTGRMKGKGVLNATFADLEHETGSLHFEGTIAEGGQNKPVEWTTVSTAVLKSDKCENTQPAAAPPPHPSK